MLKDYVTSLQLIFLTSCNVTSVLMLLKNTLLFSTVEIIFDYLLSLYELCDFFCCSLHHFLAKIQKRAWIIHLTANKKLWSSWYFYLLILMYLVFYTTELSWLWRRRLMQDCLGNILCLHWYMHGTISSQPHLYVYNYFIKVSRGSLSTASLFISTLNPFTFAPQII